MRVNWNKILNSLINSHRRSDFERPKCLICNTWIICSGYSFCEVCQKKYKKKLDKMYIEAQRRVEMFNLMRR